MGYDFAFYFGMVRFRFIRNKFGRNLYFFPRDVVIGVFFYVFQVAMTWSRKMVYGVGIFVRFWG